MRLQSLCYFDVPQYLTLFSLATCPCYADGESKASRGARLVVVTVKEKKKFSVAYPRPPSLQCIWQSGQEKCFSI